MLLEWPDAPGEFEVDGTSLPLTWALPEDLRARSQDELDKWLQELEKRERAAIERQLRARRPSEYPAALDAEVRARRLAQRLYSMGVTRPASNDALIATVAFEGISVSPDTPIERVIRFKKRHQAELGMFRTALGTLTESLQEDYPSQAALEQAVVDIYRNHIQPAVATLERSMSALKIQAKLDMVSVATFSAPATLLATLSITSSKELAILAGGSVALMVQAAKSRAAKYEKLQASPYSYLLSVRKEFGRY